MRIYADGLTADDFVSVERSPDTIHHPPHYTLHPSGIECIEITKHMNFCLGNVVKYVWRADQKGDPIENLLKARQYLDYEIERRQKEQPAPPSLQDHVILKIE